MSSLSTSNPSIYGHFFSGSNSKGNKASIRRLQGQNLLEVDLLSGDDGVLKRETYALSECRYQSPLGSTPREILFPDGSIFSSDNLNAMDAFNKNHLKQGASALLHKIEQNLLAIVAACILTAVFVWATVVHGIPAASRYIAMHVPSSIFQSEQASLYVLDETLFEPTLLSEEKQHEIRSLVEPYLEQYPELSATLHFRQYTQGSEDETIQVANAFALQGGVIILTDGLIELLTDEQQLLSIVFHEIGHLEHKHILRRTIQAGITWVALLFITGDLESADLAVGLPTLLLDLQYSREFEREADRFAIDALKTHNINPQAFAQAMQAISTQFAEHQEDQNRSIWTEYLSTHPATEERIKLAQ